MSKVEVVIAWFKSLLDKNENYPPAHIVDPFFGKEDGMSFEQYYLYEKKHFLDLAPIFDLTQDFSVDLLHECPLPDSKTLLFVYIRNNQGRLAFKMSITVKKNDILPHGYMISGNGFLSQVVPKTVIDVNTSMPFQIGLAVRLPFKANHLQVICPDLNHILTTQASNYSDDSFYTVRFEYPLSPLKPVYQLYLQWAENGRVIKEKRKIYLDPYSTAYKPFKIVDGQLIILDKNYPVHLSAQASLDNMRLWPSLDIEYPRNCSISLAQYKSFTITDCLDNDWTLVEQ